MENFVEVQINSSLHHDGRIFSQGDRTLLPLATAKGLQEVKIDPKGSLGVVTISSTIVEEIDEEVPDPAPRQDLGFKKKKETQEVKGNE